MTSIAAIARALMPTGRAWTRRADATLTKLVDGACDELERVDQAADVLGAEPVTDALLSAWTRAFGLSPLSPAAARRAAIAARLRGGAVDMSRAAYDAAAAVAGLTITKVESYVPFEVGRSAVGDPVRDDGWLHTFELTVAPAFGPGFPSDLQLAEMTAAVARLRRAHTLVRLHVAEGAGGDPDAEQTKAVVHFGFIGEPPAYTVEQFEGNGHWVWPAYFERYAVGQPLEPLADMATHVGDLLGWGEYFVIHSVEPDAPSVITRLGFLNAVCDDVTWMAIEVIAPSGVPFSSSELQGLHAQFQSLLDTYVRDQLLPVQALIDTLDTYMPGAYFYFLGGDDTVPAYRKPAPGTFFRLGQNGLYVTLGGGVWHSNDAPPADEPVTTVGIEVSLLDMSQRAAVIQALVLRYRGAVVDEVITMADVQAALDAAVTGATVTWLSNEAPAQPGWRLVFGNATVIEA